MEFTPEIKKATSSIYEKDTQKINDEIFLHLVGKNNSKKSLVVNDEYLISIDRTRR